MKPFVLPSSTSQVHIRKYIVYYHLWFKPDSWDVVKHYDSNVIDDYLHTEKITLGASTECILITNWLPVNRETSHRSGTLCWLNDNKIPHDSSSAVVVNERPVAVSSLLCVFGLYDNILCFCLWHGLMMFSW